jgi:archaellum component FlaC
MSSKNDRILRDIDNLQRKYERVRKEYNEYSLSTAPNADKNEWRSLARLNEIEEQISQLKQQLEY